MSDNTGFGDLHMHTTASDGNCTVADRVRQAQNQNLDAIAITDHDCISESISDRLAQCDRLELITGVEIRADVQETKVELLGYFVDPDDRQLTELLAKVREYRQDRNQQIIRRLRETTSLDQSYNEIQAEADGILGRPHIANILVDEEIVDSISAAFDKYLANSGTAFVPMKRVSSHKVINTIQTAGGVVSLAHPGRIRADTIEDIVEELVEAGLDAIEVQYPYDEAPTEAYADVSVEDASALAEKHGLLQTGGSDCHGPDSGKFRIGEVRVSEAQLNKLRERANKRRSL